jgi:hypothetical protein
MGGLFNNPRSVFMDEQPITPDEEVKTGAKEALPENTETDGAALPANEQEQSQTQGDEETSVPAVDDKLTSFAKGLGIEDVSALSERELKLLKVAKDNQAEFQRQAQKASELEKTLSTSARQDIDAATESGEVDAAQLALAEVAALKLQNSVSNFFLTNPDAKQHEQEMVKLITDRPQLGAMVKQGALSIPDLYAMVRGSDPTVVAEAKAQGGKQALQQLANKQLAKAVPGSATTASLSTQEKKDPFLEAFDSE